MKTYKAYITLTAALTLAACTAEDDFRTQTSDEVVQVSALIATEVQSRLNTEGDGNSFSSGDVITLQNTSRTDKNVGTYKYENSTWSPTGDAYVLWKGTENNNFQAWYPANATYTEFTIPDDQSGTNLPTADWMTATGTAKRDDGSVALAFTHLLSKVTVTISSYGTEYGDATKTISDFRINTLATEMTAAYEGGTTVTGTGASTAITPYEGTNSYTAVVAPGVYSGTFLTLNVKVGEGEAKAMTVTAPADLTLEYGKAYAFNLKVGKDKAELGIVSVTPWNEESNGLGNIQATEVKVTTVIEGTTATLDIPELATSTMVQNAVTEALTANATLLMINGQLTDAEQTAIAAALTGKTDIALVMGGVTAPATAITELTGIDLAYKNGTGENAYAVASDGTHIITGKAGLDAWRTAASSDASTNLTLACDIEYNANWSMLDITYNGTIDGNGYAIVGLNCSTTSQKTAFVNTLGSEGVIKHLGMVGGSFSISRSSSLGSGSAVFLWINNGIIMGCYNTSSCTCPGGENDYSGYASGISNSNYGKIIACYNAGTISAACDPGSGINRYNSGVISSCYNTGEVSGYGESRGYVVAAITSVNHATINDCYYTKPSTGFENQSSGTATNITKVDGNDWTAAMNTMNAAIEAYNADEANTVKCNYRYAINTDAATKSAQPLVIVEVSEL